MIEKIKNKGINIKEIIICAASLAILSGGVTAALAVTNAATKDTIATINQSHQTESRKLVIDADFFEEQTFNENGEEISYFTAKKDDSLVGYVFTVSSSGKSSGLIVMTGVSVDGKITGVVIADENETAGYIDKVKKDGLLDRLAGWDSNLKILLGENIDGVSQATKTAKGITDGVNKAIHYFNTYIKEGQ
jgi:electron transport complex protein RnfG